MATLFTRIIDGELPGVFVHRDDTAVAFMTIAPLRPGHTLVVPRLEVDHWLDLPAEVAAHLFALSQRIGQAVDRAFTPNKVAMLLLGLEVPHVHVHLVPIERESDVDLSRVDRSADPAALEAAAARIRAELG